MTDLTLAQVRRRDRVLIDAVYAGKLPEARLSYWRFLWARDPEGTEQLIDQLFAGVAPEPVGRCRWCGGTDFVEVYVLEEVYGRRMCERCGRGTPPEVVFTPVRLQPVHAIDPTWDLSFTAVVLSDGQAAWSPPPGRVPTVTYWVGPLNDQPQPPTPDELLTAAGFAVRDGVVVDVPNTYAQDFPMWDDRGQATRRIEGGPHR